MSKKTKVEIKARADAEGAVKEMYRIDQQMLIWAADEARAVAGARERCHLEQLQGGILTLRNQRADLLQALSAWAEADRKSWDGKSLETAHGEMGFRWNPPSVKVIKKIAKTFDEALALLKAKLKKFVITETVDRIDKELILKVDALAEPDTIARLEECGIKIEQKEDFWVETLVAKKLAEEIKKAKEA